MIHYYAKDGVNIRYKLSEKKHKHVVLLHGYLETLEVWDKWISLLTGGFTVLTLDLPGHGKSSFVEHSSMEQMADAVDRVIRYLGMEHFYLVGHSMGGYVAARYALMFPDRVNGLVLFHSNTLADTPEKKMNRMQEINAIRLNGLESVYCNALPRTFTKENAERFRQELDGMIANCSMHQPEGIISCIYAMTDRVDATLQIKQLSKPVLNIIGLKDPFITLQKALELSRLLGAETFLLEESGHMGFIEEREKSAEKLAEWINRH